MGVALSLLTAALYGSADFCGGLASARRRVAEVLLGAHAIGLVGVVALAAVVADAPTSRDLLFGVVGGLAGLVGVALLYRRLAIGPMHVVAPLSGVMSAIVPAMWGVVTGDRLSALAWLGVAAALIAIVLVSTGPAEDHTPVTVLVVAESLASGLGFGAFFVFLAETTEDAAPWPVASARVASVVALVCVVALTRASQRSTRGGNGQSRVAPSPGLLGLIAWAGLADTGANATFLFAAQHGDLAVVSVLSSLYPLSTVVLARVVLGDRMADRQKVGLVAALVGTSLIVAG